MSQTLTLSSVQLQVKNLPAGRYGTYRDGKLREKQDLGGDSKTLQVSLEVGPEEADLMIVKSSVTDQRLLQKSFCQSHL